MPAQAAAIPTLKSQTRQAPANAMRRSAAVVIAQPVSADLRRHRRGAAGPAPPLQRTFDSAAPARPEPRVTRPARPAPARTAPGTAAPRAARPAGAAPGVTRPRQAAPAGAAPRAARPAGSTPARAAPRVAAPGVARPLR